MSVKAIGFDLDGTLVNSLPGLAKALDRMLISLGSPVAGEMLTARWIGNGADILIKRALSWASLPHDKHSLKQARQLFDQFYCKEYQSGTSLYPNVSETLAILSKNRYKMALVTNKPTPFVTPILEQLNINHYFSTVIGGDDVIVKKPHPAPIYLILGQLGLLSEEFLFVGDSCNDIQAAKAAHCPTVGLSYGYNYGEAIANSHPDYLLDDFSGLLPILGLSISKNNNVFN